MQFFHRVILCGMAALFLNVEAGMAQSIRSERVSFAPGTSGAVLQGSLNGDQIVDYVLNVQGGQRMVVDMSTSNPSAYFNIQPAGSQQAVHNASIEGLHYDGLLPSSGDWVVRVYLMRNAARRNETANYTISVHIGGASASRPVADFADVEAGGSDYWQVTGASTLNVRSGPSTGNAVIGRAHQGQVFRNLGCRGAGGDRWCHVESSDGLVAGWVAGRYLRESDAPGTGSSWAPQASYEADAMGPDFWEVTGVPANDYLNMRTGPSARNTIVARASNGQVFRNLGCQMNGSTRWCHVQTADGRYDGWVSQRYLREGAGPSASRSRVSIPSGSATAPDLHIRPTGEIEAAWSPGCTILYNPADNRIQAGATCSGAQLSASDHWVARYAR